MSHHFELMVCAYCHPSYLLSVHHQNQWSSLPLLPPVQRAGLHELMHGADLVCVSIYTNGFVNAAQPLPHLQRVKAVQWTMNLLIFMFKPTENPINYKLILPTTHHPLPDTSVCWLLCDSGWNMETNAGSRQWKCCLGVFVCEWK